MRLALTDTLRGSIGVFDSGVGGLSVLRAIRAALPHEHLVYVADSGHAPYGDQSEAHITQRTLTVGNWLAEQGVKGITIACNTATVVAAKTLREQTHLPVVDVKDTVGAGDTFWGSCLADWVLHGTLTDPHAAAQRVPHTLQRALVAAAINCSRIGCQPPDSATLDAAL